MDRSNCFVDVEFAAQNLDSCYWNWAAIGAVDDDLVVPAYEWMDLVAQADPVVPGPVYSAMDTFASDAVAPDRIELEQKIVWFVRIDIDPIEIQ